MEVGLGDTAQEAGHVPHLENVAAAGVLRKRMTMPGAGGLQRSSWGLSEGTRCSSPFQCPPFSCLLLSTDPPCVWGSVS